MTIGRFFAASNLLIDKDGNVKLSSFGVSKYVQGGDPQYMMAGFEQSKVGTFRYMAPEVVKSEPYGVLADVWSFGATMIEIATGRVVCVGGSVTQSFRQASLPSRI